MLSTLSVEKGSLKVTDDPSPCTTRRGVGHRPTMATTSSLCASIEEADVTGTGQGEPRWFKSSQSGGGDCVEVAFMGDDVWVRDSKDPDGTRLVFSQDAWHAFLADVKDGPDHPSEPQNITVGWP